MQFNLYIAKLWLFMSKMLSPTAEPLLFSFFMGFLSRAKNDVFPYRESNPGRLGENQES